MNKAKILIFGLTAIVGLAATRLTAAPQTPGAVPENVKALLVKRCVDCHGGKNPPKGLSLEPARIAAAIDAPSKELPALKIIDAAEPGSSYLLKKVLGAADITDSRMPRRGKPLTAAEIDVLKAWLQGLKKG
jgi:mono/diheme cytochrome c family protein